jgi:hypothetical protein
MAEFQYMHDVKLPGSITAIVGNSIPLKLIPSGKELAGSISIAALPITIAEVTNVNVRTKANFTTFHLKAKAVGTASMSAGGSASPAAVMSTLLAGPIQITVEPKLEYPAIGTDAGMLTRLLLAETPSPDMKKIYNEKDARTVMIWMRVVLANRLATPSHIWGSTGAKTLADVVKSTKPSVQFEGFSQYPTISKKIQARLDDLLSVANDGSDPRRENNKKFIQMAIEVAGMNNLVDPCKTGLYFWRTAGSGKPSPEAIVYQTLMNNTFYTLPKK